MTISEMQKSVHETAKEKGWYDKNKRGNLELIALIHSELSEAVEEIRNGKHPIYFDEQGKPEGIAIELADAVIRIMDMCEYNGWNLEKAVELKMEYNKTRPYRHGNKLY